jgi:hypothetical protein
MAARIVGEMWDRGAVVLQLLDQRIHNTAAPQQANGSSVLVCWSEIGPNASVVFAFTWHYVQPSESSLDIQAEVKTFLWNILCIAALMWDFEVLTAVLLKDAWPCTGADVSNDHGAGSKFQTF